MFLVRGNDRAERNAEPEIFEEIVEEEHAQFAMGIAVQRRVKAGRCSVFVKKLRELDKSTATLLAFKVRGEDRQRGALGICTPFEQTIYAVDRKEAEAGVHQIRTQDGRENVLITHCEVI